MAGGSDAGASGSDAAGSTSDGTRKGGGAAIYAQSWLRSVDQVAAPGLAAAKRALEASSVHTCAVCKSPILPKQGTTQLGFFYASEACRSKHMQTAEYELTQQRANRISDAWSR